MSRPPFLRFVPEDAPPNYVAFWQFWQDEKWFEAHEVLEDLWRETHNERKLFFNGLIHAAVALYQHKRDNAVGACRQSVRMQEKLAPFWPQFYGVQVSELIRLVETEIAPSWAALTQAQRAQLDDLRVLVREKQCRN